jgi:hypothetical protein
VEGALFSPLAENKNCDCSEGNVFCLEGTEGVEENGGWVVEVVGALATAVEEVEVAGGGKGHR